MELGNKRGKFTLKLWIARIFYQLKARTVKHLECLFQKTKKKNYFNLKTDILKMVGSLNTNLPCILISAAKWTSDIFFLIVVIESFSLHTLTKACHKLISEMQGDVTSSDLPCVVRQWHVQWKPVSEMDTDSKKPGRLHENNNNVNQTDFKHFTFCKFKFKRVSKYWFHVYRQFLLREY